MRRKSIYSARPAVNAAATLAAALALVYASSRCAKAAVSRLSSSAAVDALLNKVLPRVTPARPRASSFLAQL